MATGIGGRLRLARTTAGITARELDRLAGRAEGHAALIESDTTERPRASDVLLSYADVLGLSLDWLAAGRGRAPREADVLAAVERARRAA